MEETAICALSIHIQWSPTENIFDVLVRSIALQDSNGVQVPTQISAMKCCKPIHVLHIHVDAQLGDFFE